MVIPEKIHIPTHRGNFDCQIGLQMCNELWNIGHCKLKNEIWNIFAKAISNGMSSGQ